MERTREEAFLLTVNGGSSSVKFALFRGADLARLLSGTVDRAGRGGSTLTVRRLGSASGEPRPVAASDTAGCARLIAEVVSSERAEGAPAAIGHRVVHGGPRYAAPERIDAALLAELRRLSPFDPDHLPAEIELIEACASAWPGVPQIACFDTAFHRTMPPVARLLALPRRYIARGIERYGFHGLSYASLIASLEAKAGPEAARGRVILAHLGNGASLAALSGGRSIDTTMAFSPASGIPMGTRSGDVDPGLVAWFAQEEGMDAAAFSRMANRESGLLGVSETSSDMRDLLAREHADPRAADAVALFCYAVRKAVGAFAAALGGLDTLVFAGGIGENSSAVRERIAGGLAFLGVELDPEANAAGAPILSRPGRPVTVRLIPTDEESEIARSASLLLGLGDLRRADESRKEKSP